MPVIDCMTTCKFIRVKQCMCVVTNLCLHMIDFIFHNHFFGNGAKCGTHTLLEQRVSANHKELFVFDFGQHDDLFVWILPPPSPSITHTHSQLSYCLGVFCVPDYPPPLLSPSPSRELLSKGVFRLQPPSSFLFVSIQQQHNDWFMWLVCALSGWRPWRRGCMWRTERRPMSSPTSKHRQNTWGKNWRSASPW